MRVLTSPARAKINLCLFVGPTRADGRHEVVTLMDSLELCDDVRLVVDPPGLQADEVICPGVEGPNLAAAALAAFREQTKWDGPPLRLEIVKRIPIAGGMAGGSADAAAALRLAAEAAGLDDRRWLEDIAAGLGADVPSQIRGGLTLATGIGARLRPLDDHLDYSVVVVPVDEELHVADVYAEADRLGLARDALGLARSLTRVQAALSSETVLDRVQNDLQDAARSLCPAIDVALEAALAAGADHAIVSGSGPTVLALFSEDAHRERAAAAAAALAEAGRVPAPILTWPAGPVLIARRLSRSSSIYGTIHRHDEHADHLRRRVDLRHRRAVGVRRADRVSGVERLLEDVGAARRELPLAVRPRDAPAPRRGRRCRDRVLLGHHRGVAYDDGQPRREDPGARFRCAGRHHGSGRIGRRTA